MRVSERDRYSTVTNRIEQAKANNTTSLNIMSSQKRINALHDDPIGAARAIRQKDNIGDVKTFQKNIDFTKGFLETTETALTNISDRLIRAKELAIAMANDNYDSKSREATSREISEIINEVIQLGNSNYNNRFVFSGFRTQTPPLSMDGNYLGDDGMIFLQIENDNFKQINIPGRNIFTTNGEGDEPSHLNLIDGITMLKQGLQNDDKQAIYRSIDELGYQLEKVTSFQANVGATWNAISKAQERLESQENRFVENLSKIEDADIYKATSDFKRTESILQSTLLASNKLLQPSLLNFVQ